MQYNETNSTNWSQRVTAEMHREPKRTSVLVVLVGILALMGVRLAVNAARPAPTEAVQALAAEPPQPTVDAEFDEISRRDSRRDEYIRQIDRTISRDIFMPNPHHFPPTEGPTARGPKAVTMDQAGQKQQAARQVVLAQAQALVLQSTVVSDRPTAIINGQVLRVGDRIAGFEVVEISSHACKVRMNDLMVELVE